MFLNQINKKCLVSEIAKRSKRLFFYSVICLIPFTFSSCYKDVKEFIEKDLDTANIAPEYSVPLGNFSFNITDQLEGLRGLMGSYPDTLIYATDSIPCPAYIDSFLWVSSQFSGIAKEVNNIKLLMLRFIFSNGYPTDLEVEALLCLPDSNEIYNVGRYTIEGADIDENNRVTGYQFSDPIDVNIPDNIIEILNQVTLIRFNYRIQTRASSDDFAWFFEDYDIKLHVGARVQYNISVQ